MSTLDRELTLGYDPRNAVLGKPRQGDVVEWPQVHCDTSIIWLASDGTVRRLPDPPEWLRGYQWTEQDLEEIRKQPHVGPM